jgi:hypothetical protein
MTVTMTPGALPVYREWPLVHPNPSSTLEGMARRIVPSHFRKDGRPKTAYESESVARQEAKRFGKTYYRCDFCNRFHLASKP